MMSAIALRSEVATQDELTHRAMRDSSVRARGAVNVTTTCRDGTTYRQQVYESGALRVRFPHEERPGLTSVLVNTGGGMTGGDSFAISAIAGPRSNLTVTSTAAEKIYRSTGDFAELRVSLSAMDQSSLAWLPQEAIIFDGARIKRSYDVDLVRNASLLACDINCIGRTAMGESVHSLQLLDQWRIRIDGQLCFADQTRIDGDAAEILRRPTVADGATSFATLLVAGPQAGQACEFLRGMINGRPAVKAGVGLFNGICVARLISSDLKLVRQMVIDASCHVCDGVMPRSWVS
jgi:urease accessory protein